ncbi:MAG: type II secretion system protein N [Desulfobulbaceae bacterium]|nr:type II secretion system protein N [Desulfobulbaceae bacterium]
MKGWKGWLALTIALYLFFLFWTIPAGFCWAWLASRPESKVARLTMLDLHGPWSAGNCALVKVGPLQLHDLSWRLRPLSLLRGRLEFALRAGLPDSGQTTAIVSLGRRELELGDWQIQGAATSLGRTWLPGLPLTGTLRGKDLHLLLAGGLPVAAAGQLTWQGAGVELTAPVAVGDLAVQLQSDAAGITANLKDSGRGPLRLEIQTRLKADGAYELTGEVAPRGAIPPELSNMLGLLGPHTPDGRIRLSRTGQLAPFY